MVKRYIKSTNYFRHGYRYEVYCTSPNGIDSLLGGSNSLDDATEIAIRQIQEFYNSPFETDKRKRHFIDNTYIYDTKTNSDVTTYALEEAEDNLMNELDSRLSRSK